MTEEGISGKKQPQWTKRIKDSEKEKNNQSETRTTDIADILVTKTNKEEYVKRHHNSGQTMDRKGDKRIVKGERQKTKFFSVCLYVCKPIFMYVFLGKKFHT